MRNKMDDLRNHLFATLEALQDTENPMDIERAKAVAEVGSILVQSAKVEVDFIRCTGQEPVSHFFNSKVLELPSK